MRNARGHWMLLLVLICGLCACSDAPSSISPAGTSRATAAPNAQSSTTPAPQGQIESTLSVEDPIFGFSKHALALERRVEMLQWRHDGQGNYATQWSAAQIDSDGFDKAHVNPRELPFNGERWWTRDARLDGQPVSADLLAVLDAWQPYAPDLRQLPPNLAASFQPDGEWLSTSQEPRHPVVGDVRLHWRILERAAPPSGVALRNGRWELPADRVADPPKSMVVPTASSSNGNWLQRIFGAHLSLLAIIGVVLALLFLFWRRRRS